MTKPDAEYKAKMEAALSEKYEKIHNVAAEEMLAIIAKLTSPRTEPLPDEEYQTILAQLTGITRGAGEAYAKTLVLVTVIRDETTDPSTKLFLSTLLEDAPRLVSQTLSAGLAGLRKAQGLKGWVPSENVN